jgi:hypothetical protein
VNDHSPLTTFDPTHFIPFPPLSSINSIKCLFFSFSSSPTLTVPIYLSLLLSPFLFFSPLRYPCLSSHSPATKNLCLSSSSLLTLSFPPPLVFSSSDERSTDPPCPITSFVTVCHPPSSIKGAHGFPLTLYCWLVIS